MWFLAALLFLSHLLCLSGFCSNKMCFGYIQKSFRFILAHSQCFCLCLVQDDGEVVAFSRELCQRFYFSVNILRLFGSKGCLGDCGLCMPPWCRPSQNLLLIDLHIDFIVSLTSAYSYVDRLPLSFTL